MKMIAKLLCLLILFCALSGCAAGPQAQIAATTLPVYQFTQMLCQGTPITVTRLVTESVSCLHDYTLTVDQMRSVEAAEVVVVSGAGLEEFMEDVLSGAEYVIDASAHVPLLEGGCHHHEAEEAHHHHHELDSHIWLSPVNAALMAQNICDGLCSQYPEYKEIFNKNLTGLLEQLEQLHAYGTAQLSALKSREIITFHDGFAYLAQAYGIEILEAIEEESGSESSAQELIELIEMVEHHRIPAIFTEINGSASAASILSAETGVPSYPLDMAMSGEDYFSSMYRNIDTLKEALQ